MNVAVDKPEAPATYPEGQYAKVEMMGHRTLWGRISEVTLFGAAMLKIEPIVGGKIVGEVLTGAASIYCLTKVSAVTAFGMAPSNAGYDNTLRLLAPPSTGSTLREIDHDDDDEPDGLDEERASRCEVCDGAGCTVCQDEDVDEIPEAPPTPHNPALDPCEGCGHHREHHPEDKRCVAAECTCERFELELPF